MSEFSTELNESQIKLTPAAREKMVELLSSVEDDEVKAIRVFVNGGGCGGMGYGMTFANEQTSYDSVLQEEEFALYIDSVALNYLAGVEIDFADRGVGGASFVFNNVFAATGGSGTCGACGAAGGGCA